ncbi:MAG TPA: thiamine phosphate synthase [Burkholderiaceae bacterium]|nr:thiamine phosphate synthase [Burkholderiaceae bacterium]HPE01121.1 thiamine phosphate synthase [Burkholderiaceae bacterium]
MYAITPDATGAAFERVLASTAAALECGVGVVQFRNKAAHAAERLRQAERLRRLTREAGAALFVNDDIELALAVDADGLHAGRDDGTLSDLRKRLGPGRLLGASCYAEPQRAELAAAAGADVLAFGAVFTSNVKPHAVHAPLELLGAARARHPQQRIVAIGGIAQHNIEQVAAAGAHAAALISALYDAADAAAAARLLVLAFAAGRSRLPPDL